MRRSIATGTPSAAEDLGQQRRDRRRVAQHDRDLLRRVALLGDQARDLRRDELELGALAAALQQRHRVAGVDRVGLEQPPVGGQLEQLALEVVQRRAGRRRVVLGARLQRHGARRGAARRTSSRGPENAIRPGS